MPSTICNIAANVVRSNNENSVTDNNSLNHSVTETHVWSGVSYILTWREGQDTFTWDEAKSHCLTRGMAMVSLDNKDKVDHFLRVVEEEGVAAFWAGGEISRDKRLLRWENGSPLNMNVIHCHIIP